MKILVSGFETFGHHLENSSEVIVKLIREKRPEISTIILPVTFQDSWPMLKEKIDLEKPDYVMSLGLAGNRKVISLEKMAINWIDCDISDNAGIMIREQLIDPKAPAAYFSTLPLSDFKKLKTNFPFEISLSAGSYLCNYLMYHLLHHTCQMKCQGGFIHLPHLGESKDLIYECICEFIDYLSKEPPTRAGDS